MARRLIIPIVNKTNRLSLVISDRRFLQVLQKRTAAPAAVLLY